ncbi:MAG: hypothetical protein WC745_02030 [Patescibacteria group bacterium]|jgi:predicted transcriptional regulator
MLQKLFGSKARVSLLKLFLLNAEEKFFVRELSRRLGLQVNSIARELDNLEAFGLLTSKLEIADQKKYYRANRDFILLGELKNLIIRSQVLYEKDFSEKMRRIGNLRLLVLSGIFAGWDAGPVDILVVGKLNKAKFLQLISEMEKEIQKELNFTIMDSDEFKYRKDMTDVFLYSILEGKKIVLIDEIGLL